MGIEPMMEVLQTSALTTWLRRLMYIEKSIHKPPVFGKTGLGKFYD